MVKHCSLLASKLKMYTPYSLSFANKLCTKNLELILYTVKKKQAIQCNIKSNYNTVECQLSNRDATILQYFLPQYNKIRLI